jgi:hypothetical protein
MNNANIEHFLNRFCEATACEVQEKTDSFMTVKLSEEADRQLTNRPYYWLFVERTGAPAETMKMKWLFDVSSDQRPQHGYQGIGMPSLACHYGGAGLERIFKACKESGRFVRLFEHADEIGLPKRSRALQTWACFNIKIEFICDIKKDDLLSVGINLQTGKISTRFHSKLLQRDLRPQLPARIFLAQDLISLHDAWQTALLQVRQYIDTQDRRWADEANIRMNEELEASDLYFSQMTASLSAKPDDKVAVERLCEMESQQQLRQSEIKRQYAPRIQITLINGGLFHLNPANSISNAV